MAHSNGTYPLVISVVVVVDGVDEAPSSWASPLVLKCLQVTCRYSELLYSMNWYKAGVLYRTASLRGSICPADCRSVYAL